MKIQKIQFHHIRIPLRVQFAQANQNTKLSDAVVVRIKTIEGTSGYGESCPRTYVTGESINSVRECLIEWQEELYELNFITLEGIARWTSTQLEKGKGSAAVCAIELALLDAWCWEYQKDLKEELGIQRESAQVAYSGVLPWGNWIKLAPVVASLNFPNWKFKAYGELAPNLHRIREMRTLFGDNTPIRMDANGGWSLATAREQISKALEQGVCSFEQPLAKEHDEDAAELVAEFGERARILADESLCTYADAERLITQRQCNHFSLKLSKNGGLLNALKIYRLAKENGISCQLSAHYGETSILSAAGLLFAMLAPDLTACEGALGTFLLREDITKVPLMINHDGEVQPSKLPYLGWPVAIDEMKLNQYSVRTELWQEKQKVLTK